MSLTKLDESMCTPHYPVSITVKSNWFIKVTIKHLYYIPHATPSFSRKHWCHNLNKPAILSKQGLPNKLYSATPSYQSTKEVKIRNKIYATWLLTLHKVACADLGTNQDVPLLPCKMHDNLFRRSMQDLLVLR